MISLYLHLQVTGDNVSSLALCDFNDDGENEELSESPASIIYAMRDANPSRVDEYSESKDFIPTPRRLRRGSERAKLPAALVTSPRRTSVLELAPTPMQSTAMDSSCAHAFMLSCFWAAND